MSGTCETCQNRETCRKVIGTIFGFCKTDYAPIEKEKEGERDDHQRPKRRRDDK